MEIVSNLVDRELVFESPWGNKIHFRLNGNWLGQGMHDYYIDLSPAVELKVILWVGRHSQQYHFESDSIENLLSAWKQPRTHVLDKILCIFESSTDFNMPWYPCSEDRPKVREYLNERFSESDGFIDTAVTRRYQFLEPGELIDEDHPNVQHAKLVLSERKVWSFDSEMNDLNSFASHVEGAVRARNLLRPSGGIRSRTFSMNLVDYILSKVKR